MPRKKKSAYEKYISAQKSIKSILAKYDGNRQTILVGRATFHSSKDEQFRQHFNDCKNIRKFEKIVKEYEDSAVVIPPPSSAIQEPATATATAAQPQDLQPCPHSDCNHCCHNDVSIYFSNHLHKK